jgi:hypothetical protein
MLILWIFGTGRTYRCYGMLRAIGGADLFTGYRPPGRNSRATSGTVRQGSAKFIAPVVVEHNVEVSGSPWVHADGRRTNPLPGGPRCGDALTRDPTGPRPSP